MKEPVLYTQRLILGSFEDSDAEDLARIAGQWEITDATVTLPYPFTLEKAAAWIQDCKQFSDSNQAIAFAVRNLEDNRLIGYTGLRELDLQHFHAELSFWIDHLQTGKGYATEAVKAAIAYAFETLGLNRIYAYHLLRNTSSRRILEKAGMQQEGHLRQCVFKWNRFEDALLWAILKNPT